MPVAFTVARAGDGAPLTVQPGQSAPLSFEVTNGDSAGHDLGLRVAVMNVLGREEVGAAQASWLSIQPPASDRLASGGSAIVTVTAAVPADAPRTELLFTLVAYDLDRPDEGNASSPTATISVPGDEPDPDPDPVPVGEAQMPWWGWLGGGLLLAGAIVCLAIPEGTGLIFGGFIFSMVALALLITSAVIGRKGAPKDPRNRGVGFAAVMMSALIEAYFVASLIRAVVLTTNAGSDNLPQFVVLHLVLIGLTVAPLLLGVMVIKRNPG